jgi:hypothetical protein
MNLPMLIVIHDNPLFNSEESLARWEETVTSILKHEHGKDYATHVINTAKAQLKLMESWTAERQILVSLKLPQCQLEICLQRYPTTAQCQWK